MSIELQIIEWWCTDDCNEEENMEIDSDNSDHKECNCNVCKQYIDTKSANYKRWNYINRGTYRIRCFGRTEEGKSVTILINGFKPFYYIKMPNTDFTTIQLAKLLNYIEESYLENQYEYLLAKKDNGKHYSTVVKSKDIYGFNNLEEYTFVKLVFRNEEAMKRSRYLFKNPIHISGITSNKHRFKIYESNFPAFMRYCHLKNILMSGWIRIPENTYEELEDHTDISIEVDRTDIEPIEGKHLKTIAPFIQASWDIETYSYDYRFPMNKFTGEIHPKNVVYQIATVFKKMGENNIYLRHIFTLKKCNPITELENIVIEECKSEKELLIKWSELIKREDPDIMYTYNGDKFDHIYVYKRAKMLGILNKIMSNLSRLIDHRSYLKHETFSSSAYGDNIFDRFYIPGRLQYDLNIHYRRGLKKYESYKLDYISDKILGERKHPFTAKMIFQSYESNDPQFVKDCALYCLKDTELLQQLVDKQKILTNIIQLANVTYVPISFVLTRGQTIKVMSQILRKGRQMGFVVPDTNFNEDTNPIGIIITNKNQIAIKSTEDARLKEFIGKYGEIVKGKPGGKLGDKLGGKSSSKKDSIHGIISDIIIDDKDPNKITIVMLSNTELEEQHQGKLKLGYQQFDVKIWPYEDTVDDSFTGATVLEPKIGFYDDDIVVLDFASLYPTTEIANNLCFSTLIKNPTPEYLQELQNKGIIVKCIEWDDQIALKFKESCCAIIKSTGKVCGKPAKFCKDNEYFCGTHNPYKEKGKKSESQKKKVHYKYYVVQPKTRNCITGEEKYKGVIPTLLSELYTERKLVKKQMKLAHKDGDYFTESLLDMQQLAIKVCLNSVYGFVSRNKGNLVMKEIGQLTTALGRKYIEMSKDYAENAFSQLIKKRELITHKLVPITLPLNEQQKQSFLLKYKISS